MAKIQTRGLTITMKVLFLVGVLALFTLFTIGGYQLLVNKIHDLGVDKSATIMMDGYKRELKDLVQTQATGLATVLKDIGDDEGQRQAITATVKDIRFGAEKTDYFFVYTQDGTVVTVPPKPELAGKNLSGAQDKKGNFFIKDLVAAAAKGGDYVFYYFPKAGSDVPAPKLAYAMPIPGTSFWIGTGVYVDDVDVQKAAVATSIDDATSSYLTILFICLAVGVALVTVLTWVLIMSVIKPVKALQGVMHEVSIGKLDVDFGAQFGGEMGRLQDAVREMVEKLQARADVARAIAEGDLSLTVQVDSDVDVLGRSMRTMTDKLNDLLGQIHMAGDQISSGSAQVADSGQTLANGATQQAAAIEEISSSMAELASQTRQNAENAGIAKKLGEEMQTAAGRGTGQMQSMVTAMHEINEAGSNISRIIKTIDEIAFQTNLLALNAAVEAARAGQHGKGFAVVAEEVRNLAARSAKAASETAELIEGSVKKAEAGVDIADRTADALKAIVGNITKANDIVSEIAASSNEQAEGIGQINQGLQQIDSVIQQNTATAEESAAAAEELSGQTAHLQSMLQQFRLRAGATGMAPQRHPAPKPVAKPAPRPVAKPAQRALPKPAPKPVVKPVAKPGAGKGWGGSDEPQMQIALDDDEFGKY